MVIVMLKFLFEYTISLGEEITQNICAPLLTANVDDGHGITDDGL